MNNISKGDTIMIAIASEFCHIQFILTFGIPNLKSKAPVKFSNWYIISNYRSHDFGDTMRFYDKISLGTGMDSRPCPCCEAEYNRLNINGVGDVLFYDGVGNLSWLPPVCKILKCLCREQSEWGHSSLVITNTKELPGDTSGFMTMLEIKIHIICLDSGQYWK